MRSTLAICRLLSWLLLATALKAQFPTPTVTSFSPTSISAGSNAFILTVNGSNFAVGTVSNVFLIFTPPGGTTLAPIAPLFGASTTLLTFPVPDTAVASAGTATFLIRNQGTFATDSAPQTFPINPPSITSISPVSHAAGAPDFTLTVNGADFVQFFPIGCEFACLIASPTIVFNGSDVVTTFIGSTQLTATIPNTLITTPGPVNVRVRNPGGSTSNAAIFTILPAPVITSF